MGFTDQPRVGIVGAGAMGSSLAAIAARFAPVVLVVREPRRAMQIFERGINVYGQIDAKASPIIVRTCADLAGIGGVTYLFIATKTWSIPEVCTELRPLRDRIAQTDAGVRLISYQNGIEPGRAIMEALETTRVMRMVINYGAVLDDKGDVEVPLCAPPHHIGCITDDMRADCAWLGERFTSAGFPTVAEEKIEPFVWAKAVVNAAFNPVCALVNGTVGQVLDSPARDVAMRLLAEGADVARAEGIDLGPDFFERALKLVGSGTHHQPSMAQDIALGRPSEVGQLNRQIVNHARKLGVPVPTHETVDALIETFDWRVYQANGNAGGGGPAPGSR